MKRTNKIFMVIYAIFMVVCIFFFLTAQDIGRNALRNELIRNCFVVAFGLACLGMALYKLVDMIKSKGGYTFKEIFFDIFIGLVFGVLFCWAGIGSVSGCIKDMKDGYEIYYIKDVKIEYALNQGTNRRSFDGKNRYELTGRCEGKKVEYRVYNTDFPESLRDRINEEAPDMVMYYYEHSNIIAQIQFHFSNGVRVVPQGEKAIDGKDVAIIENESDVVGYEAPKTYEEMDVSQATDVVINIGDYWPEVAQGIMIGNGGWYSEIKKINLEDELQEEIKTYFNITDNQSYNIYKNLDGNIIVMIYGKTDLIIQEVRAFRVVE